LRGCRKARPSPEEGLYEPSAGNDVAMATISMHNSEKALTRKHKTEQQSQNMHADTTLILSSYDGRARIL